MFNRWVKDMAEKRYKLVDKDGIALGLGFRTPEERAEAIKLTNKV